MKLLLPDVVVAPTTSRNQGPMLIRSPGSTAWPATVTAPRKGTSGFPLLPTPMRCGPSSSSASGYRPGMRRRGLRLMTSGVVVQAWQTVRGEDRPPRSRTAADAPAAPQVVAQAIPTCHSEPDSNAANPPSQLPLPPRCCDDRLNPPPQLCFTACTTAAVHFPARKSKIQGWHDRFSSASTRPSLDPANED